MSKPFVGKRHKLYDHLKEIKIKLFPLICGRLEVLMSIQSFLQLRHKHLKALFES